MTLEELAEVSARVAATRSRVAKRALIAELLRRTPPEELELVTAWLGGTLLQRRTGVGWRSLTDLPPPAARATLSLAEIDRVLERLGTLAGPGSAGRRREEIAALFGRLTETEQELLRALLTGNVRQGAQDAVVLEAIAEAAGIPVAEVRRAAMFSAPTGPVAVAALTGGVPALQDFSLRVGRPVRPMLASSAPDVAAATEKATGKIGQAFAVDTKLDGIRIQVHKHGDEVQVFTRSLDEISARLPDVVAEVRTLAATDLLLDGEALTVDDDGRPRPFQETAARTASDAGVAVRPFFFDLLHRDGHDLVGEPLEARLAALDEVVPGPLRVPRLVTGTAEEAQRFYADAVAGGQEGVVVKRLDAPYAAGRRGAAWVKVKPRHTLDLVVLAVEWGSGRRSGWLSNIHLGARNPDAADGEPEILMLGKTFKGMTDEMLAWQTERFLALETRRERHVVHVRPEQVVEIAFDGLQRSTRYPGGLALRFARVVRYRDDKTAAEADTIDAVRALVG